jgi:hypothetical protein
MDVASVRLIAEDQVIKASTEGGGGTPPVLKHRRGAVTHVQAQVERLIRPGRDAALPARHHDVNRVPVKGRPGQHVNITAPLQVRRRIRGCHAASLPSRGCASPAARRYLLSTTKPIATAMMIRRPRTMFCQ